MSDLNKKPPRKAGAVGAATEAIVDKRAAPVNTLTHDGSHNNASRQRAALPTDKLPSFPTMLRKVWSGAEVQRWIDDNIKPLVQERHFESHCTPDATPAGAPSRDVEQMLRDCVPGGSIADPQRIADSIREWFAERLPIASYDGTHIQNHCPECSEFESECTCAQEVGTNNESEDAYVIRRLSEALADINVTLRGDDAPLIDEPINPIDRVRQLAEVLRMELELYRAQATVLVDARERIPSERKVLASILRGMCEGGGAPSDVDIYADDYSAPDGDVFVLRAAELLNGDITADTEEAKLSAAARDVLAERARQIFAEGWTPELDDQYTTRDLAHAAGSYAISGRNEDLYPTGIAPDTWPWPHSSWKNEGERRSLVKAGALILAEIERVDRAAARAQSEGSDRADQA